MPRQNAYTLHVFTGCKCENRVWHRPRNRTRVPRVAGEDSTIEPAMRMQTRPRHLRITHLPVSDVTWRAIRASVRMTDQLRR